MELGATWRLGETHFCGTRNGRERSRKVAKGDFPNATRSSDRVLSLLSDKQFALPFFHQNRDNGFLSLRQSKTGERLPAAFAPILCLCGLCSPMTWNQTKKNRSWHGASTTTGLQKPVLAGKRLPCHIHIEGSRGKGNGLNLPLSFTIALLDQIHPFLLLCNLLPHHPLVKQSPIAPIPGLA